MSRSSGIEELRARLKEAQARTAELEATIAALRGSRLSRLGNLVRQARREPRRAATLVPRAIRIVRAPSQIEAANQRSGPGDPIAGLRRALRRGKYESVIARADKLLAVEDPEVDALKVLDLKSQAHWRRGDMTEALNLIRRIRVDGDGGRIADRERALKARMTELDSLWLPRVAGPVRTYEPDPGVVLHLFKESYPYAVNGFTMRNRYTLQAQRAAGIDPHVVTSMNFPRKLGITEFPALEILEDTPHHRLDLGPDYPHGGPVDMVLRDTAWAIAKIARAVRPGVVHASAGYRGYETGLVGMALREHLRRPFIYEIRSFHEETWTGEAHRAGVGEHVELRRAAENRCMRNADAVITIGEAMRQVIIGRGVPAERVHVMPNGVDADLFVPRPPNEDLRARLGLDGHTVVGYISNLDHPREGHEVLIRAMARLRAADRKVKCLIVGGGARQGGLESLAAECGVAADVVFTGQVPHEAIRDMYALIEVFVVPRIEDQAARLVTPLKPFEAMAMQCTMVVADLPALVEVVEPGTRGLSFAPGDDAALCERIEHLLDRPELRASLATEGRRWVAAERTWKANGPRYRELYAEVAARWAQGRPA